MKITYIVWMLMVVATCCAQSEYDSLVKRFTAVSMISGAGAAALSHAFKHYPQIRMGMRNGGFGSVAVGGAVLTGYYYWEIIKELNAHRKISRKRRWGID